MNVGGILSLTSSPRLSIIIFSAIIISAATSSYNVAFVGTPSLPSLQRISSSERIRNAANLSERQQKEIPEVPKTIQDDRIPNPASMVFYDEVIDDSIPNGIVCARGVCVLADFDDDDDDSRNSNKEENSLVSKVLNSYLGPRMLLAGASVLYGTNFPLGSIMNDALPASAATCDRMVLASLALSPFLPKLSPKLSRQSLLCGCFTALGYITQSLALVDVTPATVAFLGAVTVLICPTLEALVDKKPMGIRDRPQTWLAAILCLLGVGILELYNPSGEGLLEVGSGDALAILQAIGFGTSFFLTERMMRDKPDQALPITAVQVSVTAFVCMIWCLLDGWVWDVSSTSTSYGLTGLFFDPSLGSAAQAVAWTGLITTAMNRFVETTSLGKVESAEASVLLATEPLWAALFAALWLQSDFGLNDYIGGALIVLACVANTLKPSDILNIFSVSSSSLK